MEKGFKEQIFLVVRSSLLQKYVLHSYIYRIQQKLNSKVYQQGIYLMGCWGAIVNEQKNMSSGSSGQNFQHSQFKFKLVYTKTEK